MWLEVFQTATSFIQTRFDVGTESAELQWVQPHLYHGGIQFSFIGNFHIFCHRNENDDGFVVFCSDLSFHWYIGR